MRLRTLACMSLALAASAAAGSSPAPADAGPATTGTLSGLHAEEQMAVPPGSPEDQALWKAGNEVSERIVVERALSSRLQWNGKNLQYAERLEALARGGDAAKARPAAELLEKYRAATLLNWQTATRQWPIDPTRGCRYAVLDLQGVMTSSENPRKAAQLAVMRDNLKECLGKGQPALQVMAGSNRDLETLQGAAEALLPPLPVTAGPASPASPAAGGAAK